jgi:hypothetical protein
MVMAMIQRSFDPFNFLNRAANDCDGGLIGQNRGAEVERLARGYARAERDYFYRELKKDPTNKNVRRYVLKNQLEKYQALGVEGRGYRDVYYVQYTRDE